MADLKDMIPMDKESWKFCGILEHHYDWNVRQWREYFGDMDNQKFEKCYCCGKQLHDKEKPYAAFMPDGIGFQIQTICKCCAYRISDKVTDYEANEKGDVKVVEWCREQEFQIQGEHVALPDMLTCLNKKYGTSIVKDTMMQMCFYKPFVSPNYPEELWRVNRCVEVGTMVVRSITSEYCKAVDELRLVAACCVHGKRRQTLVREVYPATQQGFINACEWLTRAHREVIEKWCL